MSNEYNNNLKFNDLTRHNFSSENMSKTNFESSVWEENLTLSKDSINLSNHIFDEIKEEVMIEIKLDRLCKICKNNNKDDSPYETTDTKGPFEHIFKFNILSINEKSLLAAKKKITNFNDSNFTNAILQNKVFSAINFASVDVASIKKDIERIIIREWKKECAKVKSCTPNDSQIRNIVYEEIFLENITHYTASFKRCNFVKTNMRANVFRGVDFTGSNFIMADMYNSTILDSNLSKCDFSYADLSMVDFASSELRGSNFNIGENFDTLKNHSIVERLKQEDIKEKNTAFDIKFNSPKSKKNNSLSILYNNLSEMRERTYLWESNFKGHRKYGIKYESAKNIPDLSSKDLINTCSLKIKQ